MKICKDCRHCLPYKERSFTETFWESIKGIKKYKDRFDLAKCKLTEETDVVTGEKTYDFCSTMRIGHVIMGKEKCGPAGGKFQHK